MKINFDIKKYILVIIAGIIFACDIYFGNNILIVSFEQCIYTLIKLDGSSGAPIVYAIIYILICSIILCSILLIPVLDFGKRLVITIKNKSIQLYPILNAKIYGIVLLVISIIGLLKVVDIFPFIKNTLFSSTDIFDDYYVDSGEVDITFPKEKNNLVYIIVESLESTNFSIENGGLFEESIIPNLEQMAIDNINFSNNDIIGGAYGIDGAGWTAASMIAHTSGVPFKISFGDLYVNSTKFMNVTTIGDILASNGYDNYLLLGSDASFGGRKAYFASHNYLIKDYYSAIEEGKIEEDYYEWWGYEDAKLFEYAKEMLTEIANNDEPFNLTMLTADTHFIDGYLDESCVNAFDIQYANSFYCSDSKIYEFVEWIKSQDFYEDTTIVIVGDHYTMQDNFYDNTDDYERTIYNVFINANVNGEYNSKNRVFTVLDMFPTTVAALGADIDGDRLGLGTNLFSDKMTIPEMMGIDVFNGELIKYSNYYYNYIR